MIDYIKENKLISLIAFLAIILLIGVIYLTVSSGASILGVSKITEFETYVGRRQTAAGDFQVTYSYPSDWQVTDNGAKYVSEDEDELTEIYFVFESLRTEYLGTKKIEVGERYFFKNTYSDQYTEQEMFIIDYYWPIRSIDSTVRISCISNEDSKRTIDAACNLFVESFRLD
jgi:hypothetical protein